jgi:hypothetical protein
MRNFVAALLLAASFTSLAADLEPGQVWAYQTRPGEAKSTITVLKVEAYKDLGRVIHIRIDGIEMNNPMKGNTITEIPHLPFKDQAIQASITRLVQKSATVPEFRKGYDTWKKAYTAGQAGAFDISVGATLDALLGAKWTTQ